jgi:hypothetical protein
MYVHASPKQLGLKPTGPWIWGGHPPSVRRQGLGDAASAQQTQQIAQIATLGATTTVGILAGMHAVIGGVAMAGPVGLAIAGILALTPLIVNLFKGCGNSCVAATKVVNDAEPILQQNVAHYFSSPVRYKSMQLAALNNYDTIWAAVQKTCAGIGGAGGAGCVADRKSGACRIHSATPARFDGCQYIPGGEASDSGTCWNWFTGYRDPIANDPCVQPDPTPGSVPSSLLESVGVNPVAQVFGFPLSSLLVPAALIGAAFMIPD